MRRFSAGYAGHASGGWPGFVASPGPRSGPGPIASEISRALAAARPLQGRRNGARRGRHRSPRAMTRPRRQFMIFAAPARVRWDTGRVEHVRPFVLHAMMIARIARVWRSALVLAALAAPAAADTASESPNTVLGRPIRTVLDPGRGAPLPARVMQLCLDPCSPVSPRLVRLALGLKGPSVSSREIRKHL